MTESADDVRDRFRAYRRHRDRRLRDELVMEHAGLARSLARRYTGRGETDDDLTQVAMLGLLKAVERFDPERGLAFSTFAQPTITGELKRHFRDRKWAVHVPRGLQELSMVLRRAVAELSHRLGRSPTIEELAGHLGVDPEQVLEGMEAGRAFSASSLDASASDADDELRVLDTLGVDDPDLATMEHRIAAHELLEALPPRERAILRLRFFDGLTQSEIAARVGISQMHVSRLIARALDTLRDRETS